VLNLPMDYCIHIVGSFHIANCLLLQPKYILVLIANDLFQSNKYILCSEFNLCPQQANSCLLHVKKLCR
jgi:hypothetical protein